jgi:hypothetical protein
MGAVLEHLPIASGGILDKVNNGTWPTYSASLTRRVATVSNRSVHRHC